MPELRLENVLHVFIVLLCSTCHTRNAQVQRQASQKWRDLKKRRLTLLASIRTSDSCIMIHIRYAYCVYEYYNDIHCTCFSLLKSCQTFSLLHMSNCVQMLQTMVGQRQIHLLRSWPKNCKNVSRNYKSWRPQGPMRRRLLISEWKHVEIRFLEKNIKKSIPSSQVNAWSLVPLFTSDILLRQSM